MNDHRTAPTYTAAFAGLTATLFLCSGAMVAVYVTLGVWVAVAVAVGGGFLMDLVASWAGPALVEDEDISF